MKRILGLVSAMSLAGAGVVWAGGDKVDEQSAMQEDTTSSVPAEEQGIGGSGTEGTTEESSSSTWTEEDSSMQQGTGGSGLMGTTGSATGTQTQNQMTSGQELTGTVVKADRKTIYLDHMGAIVPLKINNQTQFEGDVKRAQDLKEGQSIRASYEVQGKTDNVAKKVSLDTGMGSGQGGSGFEGSPMNDIPASPEEGTGTGGDPLDPTLDTDMSNPQTVPDAEDSRGPGSPLPGGGSGY